jgi:hypothetical protein
MKYLMVVHDEGWAVLCALTNKTQEMNQIAGNRVYISLSPVCSSINTPPAITHTASILNDFDIT